MPQPTAAFRLASLLITVFFGVTIALCSLCVGQTPAPTSTPGFSVEEMLDVVYLGASDLSDNGRWVAVTTSTLRDRIGVDNYRFGDPTYVAPQKADLLVIDTQTAKIQRVFPDKQQLRSIRWSPDGARLAMLVLKKDAFVPVIWDRTTGKSTSVALPPGQYVAEATELRWSPDGQSLLISLRSDEWRKKERERFEYETKGPIVVHSSKEPFLAWDDLRRMTLPKRLVAYDLRSRSFREILPESKLSSFSISEDGSFITCFQDVTRKTDYDYIGGADNEIQIVPAAGGQPRTVLKSTRGLTVVWSRDGRRYCYSKDGRVFFGSIDDKEPLQLAGEKQEPAANKVEDNAKGAPPTDADKDKKEKERFTAVRLDPKGDRLVVSNKEGLWLIDTASGARELFLKMPEEDKQGPRYEVAEWSPDGDNIYLTYSSRTRWERGFVRYNVKSRAMQDLVKDGQLYAGLRLSRDGHTAVFTSAGGNRPSDGFAADADLKAIRRLTTLNPQLEGKGLSKTELITYLDADGNRTNGVLYYPAGYEPGKKYPTVFNLYEQFFDDPFNATINVLTSGGYAVMQPSVTFETGYPAEAWLKGVTAGANKLIEMGIGDPDTLGIMGTSYGGYAVNLLITQTSRFKAAINISGKVDMVSFYTDSPRLGVRNIHAPEKSQDRLGATLWQQPQKYIQQSAIMFADRIKTPLLLITGEQDPNVPARQAMEMYHALRRLGKDVEWVSYTNSGHGMPTTTVAELKDFHDRIRRFCDDHLKGDLKKKAEEQKPEPAESRMLTSR
jgi:dipeptidyl aminopeptidase/acylaminoacyl peptidase